MIFSEYEHASINKSTVVYDLMFSLYTDQEILWSNLSVNILLANQVDGQFTLPTWQAEWRLQPADPAPPPSCPAPPKYPSHKDRI